MSHRAGDYSPYTSPGIVEPPQSMYVDDDPDDCVCDVPSPTFAMPGEQVYCRSCDRQLGVATRA